MTHFVPFISLTFCTPSPPPTNEDTDIAEEGGQDAKVLANIKELAENSNISNPELDTKGQDYSLGKKEMECAYRLSQQ